MAGRRDELYLDHFVDRLAFYFLHHESDRTGSGLLDKLGATAISTMAGATLIGDLDEEQTAQLTARLTKVLRIKTYDAATGTVTIDGLRAEAFKDNLAHYSQLFREGNSDYAIQAGAVTDSDRLRKLSAFFWWSSWAASTNRPADTISYTSNWPHEKLVGNRPTGDNIVWTGVSIIVLLARISAMAWWDASSREEEHLHEIPADDPLSRWEATPSQRATIKYFWVVTALILLQMTLGILTAHYGVEGDGFYGFPLSEWLPYVVTRTWHVQAGLFWIATAWLAAGLFIGPLVSDYEPKGQRLGVNVLFGALLLVVVGSFTGEWLSVHKKNDQHRVVLLWAYWCQNRPTIQYITH